MKLIIIISIIIIIVGLIIFSYKQFYEPFANPDGDYPCRVYLSDTDFMKHMIPHHQMAIDISIEHIKHTKNDVIMKVLHELIWTQKYEILMMKEELGNKTVNISEIYSNQPYMPSVFSFFYPNVVGLTTTYCDPNFFKPHNHTSHNMALSDKQYITHMIPHHQVAVDMCKILLKHTKSDFLTFLAYRMIRGQESEISLLNDLLKSPFGHLI
jgi:hypothetical protein